MYTLIRSLCSFSHLLKSFISKSIFRGRVETKDIPSFLRLYRGHLWKLKTTKILLSWNLKEPLNRLCTDQICFLGSWHIAVYCASRSSQISEFFRESIYLSNFFMRYFDQLYQTSSKALGPCIADDALLLFFGHWIDLRFFPLVGKFYFLVRANRKCLEGGWKIFRRNLWWSTVGIGQILEIRRNRRTGLVNHLSIFV